MLPTKSYMGLKFGLALMFAVAPVGVGFCADTPSKMIHAIVQMRGTDFPAESFAAKPKMFWRCIKSVLPRG